MLDDPSILMKLKIMGLNDNFNIMKAMATQLQLIPKQSKSNILAGQVNTVFVSARKWLGKE